MGAISELYRGRISAPTDIRIRVDEYDELNANAEKLNNTIADGFATRTLYELANPLIYGDSNAESDLDVLAVM